MISDKKKNRNHIPSRWRTYHFVCRECGESDVGEFDGKTDFKKAHIRCTKCHNEQAGNTDPADYLPF